MAFKLGVTYKTMLLQNLVVAIPAILSFYILLLGPVQPAFAILTSCYDPSGDLRPDKPCNPDAPHSACCAESWVCTNITLCIAGPTVHLNPGDPTQFEGSCTDSTWNSPFCPSFCRNGNLSKNAANGMWNCSNGNWCCSAFAGDEDCCTRDKDVFFLGDIANITTIGEAIATTSLASTTSSIVSSLITSSNSGTGTSRSASTSSTSLATTTPSSSSTPSPSQSPKSSGGLSTGAKAGIAIAAVFGAAGLAVIGVLTCRQRKHTKKLQGQVNSMQNTGVAEVPAHDMKYKSDPLNVAVEEPRHEMGSGGQGEVAELPGAYHH